MIGTSEACNFFKIEALVQVFSFEFCEISKNIFSSRTPPVAASELLKFQLYYIHENKFTRKLIL